jgi:hypothetical protein
VERSTNALDDPSTARALRRYRSFGWACVVLGAAGVVAAFVIAGMFDQRTATLERSGVRVSGVVVETRRGPFLTDGSIVVSYMLDGPRRATVRLDSNSPVYEVGTEVTVIVDRTDQRRIMTTDESNDPIWAVRTFIVSIVGGPFVGFTGILMIRRARRWRPMMVAAPWRTVPADVRIRRQRGKVGRPVIRFLEADTDVVRAPTDVPPWRLRSFRNRSSFYVVGDLADRAVIAHDPGGPLFEVRNPRLRSTQRQHEALFDSPDP